MWGLHRAHVETVVGAFSLGDRNEEEGRVIDYGLLNRLAIMYTFYKTQERHTMVGIVKCSSTLES